MLIIIYIGQEGAALLCLSNLKINHYGNYNCFTIMISVDLAREPVYVDRMDNLQLQVSDNDQSSLYLVI